MKLGPTEQRVYEGVSRGLANKEIARELGIADATVRTHLVDITRKLGVRGRVRLALLYHGVRV